MDQANSLTSFRGHSWGRVICYAWLNARPAGERESIWGPECLVHASMSMSLHRKTSATLAFCCLIPVFSGDDFPAFKMCLSFRERAELMLWGGQYQQTP